MTDARPSLDLLLSEWVIKHEAIGRHQASIGALKIARCDIENEIAINVEPSYSYHPLADGRIALIDLSDESIVITLVEPARRADAQ